MERPRIFVSAVSRELKSARQRVANILTRKGYEPVWQDIFGTESGDLRDLLREKINSCKVLIQIIGEAYGAEPRKPDTEFGRCSYTQFEFLYAKKEGKDTWLLIAGADVQRDAAPALLDVPLKGDGKPDHARPDAADWQRACRKRQQLYLERPEVQTHLRHTVETDAALELIVERLDESLTRRRKKGCSITLQIAFGISILCGVLWLITRMNQSPGPAPGPPEITRTDTKITSPGIRKQILRGSAMKRDRDLAGTATAEPPEQEKLRKAVRDAHTFRISRIDALVSSLTEWKDRSGTPPVLSKMIRLLHDDGAEPALTYVDKQKAGILEHFRQRPASELEQARAELQPLLTAAALKAAIGESGAARNDYMELLNQDPPWVEALSAFAWFLRDQSLQSEQFGDANIAVADAEEAYSVAQLLPDTSHVRNQLISATRLRIAGALTARRKPGDISEARQRYLDNIRFAAYRVNGYAGSREATQDEAEGHEKLGDLLNGSGSLGDRERAGSHFSESFELREKLLRGNPGAIQEARDAARISRKLADFLQENSRTYDELSALKVFQRNLEIWEEVLRANPGLEGGAAAMAESLVKMRTFVFRASLRPTQQETVQRYLLSLDFCDAQLSNLPFQEDVARNVALSRIVAGRILQEGKRPEDAIVAIPHFARSLQLYEPMLKANPGSADLQGEAASVLIGLGDLHQMRRQPGDFEQALDYYRRSLALSEPLLFDSTIAQEKVWPICRKIAILLEQTGKEGALPYWRRAYDVLAELKQKVTLNEETLRIFEELRRKVGK